MLPEERGGQLWVYHDQRPAGDKPAEPVLLLGDGEEADKAAHGVTVDEHFERGVLLAHGCQVGDHGVHVLVHALHVDPGPGGPPVANVVMAHNQRPALFDQIPEKQNVVKLLGVYMALTLRIS